MAESVKGTKEVLKLLDKLGKAATKTSVSANPNWPTNWPGPA